MLIKVTKEDITLGTPSHVSSCPIARAIMWQSGVPVHVGIDRVIIKLDDTVLVWSTPRSVRRFVRRFDHDQPVKPFSFEFNPKL